MSTSSISATSAQVMSLRSGRSTSASPARLRSASVGATRGGSDTSGISGAAAATSAPSVMGPPLPRGRRDDVSADVSGARSAASGIAPSEPKVKVDTLLKTIAVKLTGADKFETWRKSMINIAQWREWPDELLDINADKWDGTMSQARKEAYLVLNATIDESLKYLLEGVKFGDVEQAWRELCNRFNDLTTDHNQGRKIREFWGLTMETTGLPVDRFISKIREVAKSLRESGRAIPEKDMCSVLLMGLLKDFHVVADALQNKKNVNFTTICERVLKYAKDNNLELKTFKPAKKMSDAAYITVCRHYQNGTCKFGEKCKYAHLESEASGDLTQKSEKAKKIKCYNCGEAGHYKKDCKAPKKETAMSIKDDDESEFYKKMKKDLLCSVVEAEPKKQGLSKKNEEQQFWGLDSNAAEHLTNNIEDFMPETIQDVKKEMMVGNSNMLKLTKKGSIRLQQEDGPAVRLVEAFYSPELPMHETNFSWAAR